MYKHVRVTGEILVGGKRGSLVVRGGGVVKMIVHIK
jgi:hypothetical protein